MSFITGVGLTSFGRHEGSSTLDLMSKAAELAIADAGLKRAYAELNPWSLKPSKIRVTRPTPCR